jgi:hypothetical protein
MRGVFLSIQVSEHVLMMPDAACMVAGANQKRRELERDRRVAERPQPGALIQASLQTLADP